MGVEPTFACSHCTMAGSLNASVVLRLPVRVKCQSYTRVTSLLIAVALLLTAFLLALALAVTPGLPGGTVRRVPGSLQRLDLCVVGVGFLSARLAQAVRIERSRVVLAHRAAVVLTRIWCFTHA